MFPGFNTNVPFKGATYHVQTEDSGVENPVIVTHLYSGGAIVASKKSSYSHLMSDDGWRKKVPEMMRRQHRDMVEELLSGKLGGGRKAEDIDEIFMDYVTGRRKPR
jgi:hypothetical protein